MRNANVSRSYPFSYSISAANTWEYKTVTIPGDTTGTWLTNNGVGVFLGFGLGVGSTLSRTAGSWAAGDFVSATGAVSVVGTNGATFYITGVQLEAGSVATPFEQIDYGRELFMCQRYFMRWRGDASSIGFPAIATGQIANTTQGLMLINTPAALRTTPTVEFSGNVVLTDATVSPQITSISVIYTASNSSVWALITAAGATLSGGRAGVLYCVNATTNTFSLSAEL
jgi:hypothetical protein